MNHLFSSGEIIGSFVRDNQQFQVCVAAEAGYDDGHARLTVELDSFLRQANIGPKHHRVVAGWLPPKQTVNENIARAEAAELAKDIFRRWVSEVRQAIPASSRSCASCGGDARRTE